MSRRITIRLDLDAVEWTRRTAAARNTSVSNLIQRLLTEEMSRDYWRAYEKWKSLPRDLGGSIDASQRFTRDQAHERR